MLYVSIALFALAAVFGVVILKNWLTAASTSTTIVYGHGIFAAIALILLLITVLNNADNTLYTSLSLFVISAIAGFYMFFKDLKGKMSPAWLAVAHGFIAVAAFLVLLFAVI